MQKGGALYERTCGVVEMGHYRHRVAYHSDWGRAMGLSKVYHLQSAAPSSLSRGSSERI